MTCLVTNSNHSCSPKAGILLLRIKNLDLQPCLIFLARQSIRVLVLYSQPIRFVRFDRKFSWTHPEVMILGTDQNDHDLIMKNLFFTVKPVLIDNLILLMTVIIRRNLTWSGTSNVSEFCFSQPSPNVELSLLKKELSQV